MIQKYQNVIATKFETESIWQRKMFPGRIFGRKRKIAGFAGCKKLSKGALYDSNGHIIYDSIRKGGIYWDYVVSIAPIVINPDSEIVDTFPGNAAFIGNLFSQYGHFITEGLSRLSDYRHLDEYDYLVMYPFIHNNGSTQLMSYHKWFFEKLGLDVSKIRFIENTTRINSLAVYKQLWTINDSVDKSLRSLYKDIRDGLNVVKSNDLKVFLSRKNHVRVGNIHEVEQVFRNAGFEVVYPEEMNMDEQMAIYTGSNIIASLSGSSLHNIVFGGERTFFVEIGDQRTPGEPHKMQLLANSISDSRYLFIPFNSNDGANWNSNSLFDSARKLQM